ncbi:uncharacterized protein K452DRAFT_237608 [Aplosporella prunicola CBS 121167]|uniref:Delta(24)-sterol reductase n=1 Tax=Aplosporella prunicola CBS 121167 TaxID=1176127 RepID=A0A6A6AYQ2_9PEZI|nr:uncharacterized protein K452DRAFT_237608 [Aplosporella prunicola CBS 121167]KAF2136388.1 hypothetical protein K452DRAFT_237608 [Aplosporella prunicola CBS 121167]
MERHHRAVLEISTKVKSFYARNIPFRVYHGSTNSTRQLDHDADKIVDTNPLTNILAIDTEKRTALVEANVPMDKLAAKTLKHNLIPLVVPEFPGITAGGSYAGTAAESSSFRYGFFDRAATFIEIVLTNGDIVRADPDANTDLFYGAVGACGTLGVITLLELRLIPAVRYVALTYVPVYSAEEALKTINFALTEEQWDFIDAILFSQNSGMVLLGRLTDKADDPTTKVVRFSRRQDPWYFIHTCHLGPAAQTLFTTDNTDANIDVPASPPVTELVPTLDYLFRYDRGSFWMGAGGWPAWLWNRAGRYVLDAVYRTRVAYRVLHHSGRAATNCIQDVVVPVEHTETFLDFVHGQLQVYPLWLCLVRSGSKAPLHRASGLAGGKGGVVGEGAEEPAWLLNVGIWGASKRSLARYNREGLESLRSTDGFAAFVADNRALEAKVAELGGIKWLYAQNWYTEEEFWSIYDKSAYNRLRERWDARGLPSLWDKVKRRTGKEFEGSFDVGMLRGMVLSLLGKDHILRKGSGNGKKT